MFRFLDQQATMATGSPKQRLEARWVATLSGRVRVWAYRVKEPEGSFYPLDRVYALAQAEASPALVVATAR